MSVPLLTGAERELLDQWQRGFPLTPRPYATIAARLGMSESELLARLARLRDEGVISRVGATVRPNRVGASTLAAMAVPEERLEEVADLVSAQAEVNHNYEREGRFNLWFVVTASDRPEVDATLERIRQATGLVVLDLPLVREYRIDLGFPLS